MRGPVGVMLTAIVQILGSLLVLLLSIVTLLTPALMRNSRTTTPPPAMPQGMACGITAFYRLLAVLGFLTAVGLFRMRGCSKDIVEHHIEKTMGQPAGTSAPFSEAALRFFSVLGAGVMLS